VANPKHALLQLCWGLEPDPGARASAVGPMKTIEDPSARCGKPPPPLDINADCQSIVVNAPASEIYHRLLRFEDLPQFITSIRKIGKISNTRFSCTSFINGQEINSEVLIMMRVPDRRIAWQAVSDQFRVGVVFLDPLLGGTTKVTVKVRSIIEPVLLTGTLRRYLTNLKHSVEQDLAGNRSA
jgi:uncharacterized membrane protein